MSGTSHHPSADLLLSYSAGTASPGHALCVATHLEYCQSCVQAHQRNNAIGGRLITELHSQEQSQVSEGLKSRVFSLLDNFTRSPADSDQQNNRQYKLQNNRQATQASGMTTDPRLPRALRKLVPEGLNGLDWRMISTSARSCQLFKDDSSTIVSLLKLKPGGRVARHKHMGNEFTVILTGAFSDEDGVYREGDFLLRDANDSHSPVATRDAECICLTLQEAPLQFTGWPLKLVNPWIRNQFRLS